MPKEIITNGAFRRGDPWVQVGWSRDTYVQVGVLTEASSCVSDPEQSSLTYSVDTGVRFCDLDRDGINKLIRALRKARDQAYGADA